MEINKGNPTGAEGGTTTAREVRASSADTNVPVLQPEVIDIADSEDEETVTSSTPLFLVVDSANSLRNESQAPPPHPSTSPTGVAGSSRADQKIGKWHSVPATEGSPPPGRCNWAVIRGNDMLLFSAELSFDTVVVFNLISKQWSRKLTTGEVPRARISYGMDLYEDLVLLFGGFVGTVSWEWSKLKPKPAHDDLTLTARCGHTLTNVNGSLYLVGGIEYFDPSGDQFYLLGDLYVLQYREREGWCWDIPNTYGTMAYPRVCHTAVAYVESPASSKLIIFGGAGWRELLHLGDLHILDTMTNTWTQPILTGLKPSPRRGHSATVVGSRMFVFGGTEGCGGCPYHDDDAIIGECGLQKFHCSDELYVLDLKTYIWEKVRNDDPKDYWTPARSEHAAAGTSSKIYIWSGTMHDDAHENDIPREDLLVLDVEPPTQVPSKVKLVGQIDDNGLLIDWKPVEGADSYILQICEISPDEPRPLIWLADMLPGYRTPQTSSQPGQSNAPTVPLMCTQPLTVRPPPSQRHRLAAVSQSTSNQGVTPVEVRTVASPPAGADLLASTTRRVVRTVASGTATTPQGSSTNDLPTTSDATTPKNSN